MALLKGGEFAIRQVIGNLLEGRIRHVGDVVCHPVNTIRHVHFLENPLLVPAQAIVTPARRVEVPLAFRGIRTNPDRGKLGGFLFHSGHGEAELFQLLGKVFALRESRLVAIIPDQENEGNGFIFILPFAIRPQRCAQGGHFGINDFLGGIEVICILGFETTGDVDHAGVIHQLRGQGSKFWQGSAGIDFLVDVIAVNRPVHRLAQFAIREGVQHGGVFEGGRVKHETVECSIRLGVAQVGFLDLRQLVGSQAVAEQVYGIRTNLCDGRVSIDN